MGVSNLLANPTIETPPRGRRLLWVVAAACVLAAVGAVAEADAAGDQPARPLYSKEFSIRVNNYLALQRRLEAGLPPLTPSDQPTRIEVHQRGLAERIRDARSHAKAGDIFGSAGDTIRKAIQDDAKSRKVRDAYAAMIEVPVQAPPAVNADYPDKAPLATVPPLLLARLPLLPDGIEYRFMGRDLILRDMKANIIVDILHEAIPTIRP
jgi:hypothetical protein